MQMPTLRAILALIAAKGAKGAAGDFPAFHGLEAHYGLLESRDMAGRDVVGDDVLVLFQTAEGGGVFEES